jgi:hypothetical protein
MLLSSKDYLADFPSFANDVVPNGSDVIVKVTREVANIFSHSPIERKNGGCDFLCCRSSNKSLEH